MDMQVRSSGLRLQGWNPSTCHQFGFGVSYFEADAALLVIEIIFAKKR